MSGRSREQPAAVRQAFPAVTDRAGELPGRDATPVACVDEEACTPCGACQAVCPTDAIRLGEGTVRVIAEECCGCGACAEVCPNGAVKLV
jgi:Fe-S-cluster-containing hydrogenase component 2